MKYSISGTLRGVISLPYELIEELGAEHEGFGDVVIKEGKLTISPRKVKCRITEEGLANVVYAMSTMIKENFSDACFFDAILSSVGVFLAELGIKMEG